MIAQHQVPGRDGSVLQHMGWETKVITLDGFLFGTNADTNRATLEGYRDSDSTQTYSDGEDTFTVVVEDVNIPKEGMKPVHYAFSITLLVYNQT